MASDGLCFVCRASLRANDMGIRSVEFIGDTQFERGRYAAHLACAAPLRHMWLTRAPDGMLVPLTHKNAPPLPKWYRRVLAAFFAWGMTKF